jgi:hypothetical protein
MNKRTQDILGYTILTGCAVFAIWIGAKTMQTHQEIFPTTTASAASPTETDQLVVRLDTLHRKYSFVCPYGHHGGVPNTSQYCNKTLEDIKSFETSLRNADGTSIEVGMRQVVSNALVALEPEVNRLVEQTRAYIAAKRVGMTADINLEPTFQSSNFQSVPNSRLNSAIESIKRECASKWSTNFTMQEYCRKNQMEALNNLRRAD